MTGGRRARPATTDAAPHHAVVVVGAGFAGIGVASALARRGIDYCVLERADGVGGTWRDNTYPGAACDVPSSLYSFSWAPNPWWSRSFSPQPEIAAYLARCARRAGVRGRVRFGHEVLGGRWDPEASRWLLETTRGPMSADVVVSARGALCEPRLPDLPGLARFGGTAFHSARWDHGHDLTGARVAVVGTGASAVQFVPEIQPRVDRLVVFQRSAPWVVPRHDRARTRVERALYRALPASQLAVRTAVYWGREAFVLGFVGRRDRRRARMAPARRAARALLERQVADPALRAALTPDFDMGCTRILLSNDWYPALTRPNVEVVTEPVAEVTAHGIRTARGTEWSVDTIIFATGFDVSGGETTRRLVGEGGTSLAEAWGGRMAAYKAMTVPGFPNLFLMVGPNSGLGHSSIVFMIESQIAYLLDALETMRRRSLAAVEVRRSAYDAWVADIDRRSRDTVWTDGGCASYYLDDRGRNVALWPGSSWGYRRATRRFDAEAYHLHPAPASVPHGRGREQRGPEPVVAGLGAAAPVDGP